MMKNFLLALCVICTSLTASAEVEFGVRGGLNLLSMSTSGDDGLITAANQAGFYIGPTMKMNLPLPGFSFDASLLYDQRASKISTTPDALIEHGVYSSGTFSSRQFTLPLNLRYGMGIGQQANIFAFTGPQVGYSIADNRDDWSWKPWHFSWNIGVGATVFTYLEIKLNYNIACGKTGGATFWDATRTVEAGTVNSKYSAWQIGCAWYF